MGRSYNLKKSPINKGTAAKPSPAKLAGLAVGLITTAIGGGISAATAAKNRKEQEKLQKEQIANDASQNVITSMSSKIGSDTKLVD